MSEYYFEQLAERYARQAREYSRRVFEDLGRIIAETPPAAAYGGTPFQRRASNYGEHGRRVFASVFLYGIKSTFDKIAEREYLRSKGLYTARNLDFLPYAKKDTLRNVVLTSVNRTRSDFSFMSDSTAIGLNIGGRFRRVADVYQAVSDNAIGAVVRGEADYRAAARGVIEELGGGGVRVRYASGRSERLDSAVRRNILSGMRDVNRRALEAIGEEVGADGVELSVHANPAADHALYQGKQFSNEEYRQLNDGLDRQIGWWNCAHIAFPIILGVSEPQFTQEELDKLIAENDKGFEFDGKRHTMYEGTQMQRRLEVAARYAKDKTVLAKAAGDDITLAKAQGEVSRINRKYDELARASGLPSKAERMSVSGYTTRGLTDEVKRGIMPVRLDTAAQGRHIAGAPNFDPSRGTLTADPAMLLATHAGKGQSVTVLPDGHIQRERFVDDSDIGVWRDTSGGDLPTNSGMIHRKKDGRAHIVPARPERDD